MREYTWRRGDHRLVAGQFLTAENCERYAKAMMLEWDYVASVEMRHGNATPSPQTDEAFRVVVTAIRHDCGEEVIEWDVWLEPSDGDVVMYGEC